MTPRAAAPLQRYVAFLRAINVGGHVVKMDRLRAEFEALGLRDVATVIASGNVLFASPSRDAAALERKIERRLEESLGYEVTTFLRTPEEMAALAAEDPFPDREDWRALHVGFLKQPPSDVSRDRFVALGTDDDRFTVRGREAFWLCRVGMGVSKVTGPKIARALGAPTTFRSVTTVRTLAERMREPVA